MSDLLPLTVDQIRHYAKTGEYPVGMSGAEFRHSIAEYALRSTLPEAAESNETFDRKLQLLINSYSMERYSNTPDFILAIYMNACLESFNSAVKMRDEWYGINPKPGCSLPQDDISK